MQVFLQTRTRVALTLVTLFWAALNGLTAYGQTVLINANFTSGASAWIYDSPGAGTGNKWQWYSDQGVGGTGGMRCNSYPAGNYVISSAVTLSPGNTYTIKADSKSNFANARQLGMSFNTSRSRTGETLITTTSPVTTSYATYSATFTVPTAGTYYIIYYTIQYNGATSGYTFLDNAYLQGVANNTPPTVSITAPTGGSVQNNPTVSLAANASDADGTISSVAFYEGATLLGTDATSPYSVNYTFASGSHTITAVATDNLGAQTTCAAVTFSVNQPPTVSITAPTAGYVAPTGLVNITANAADTDGTVSSVAFYEGATLLGTDNTSPYALTNSFAVGSHTITAQATDNAGAVTTSASVTFSVNQPPTVSITAPVQGSTILAGVVTTLSVSASDADGAVASVAYFDGSTQIGSSSTAPFSISYTFASGSHALSATATDNLGASTASVPITILANAAPTIALASPGNGSTLEAGNIRLQANAADADGNVTAVDFYLNGAKISTDVAAPFEVITPLNPGSYSFYAIAKDDRGASTTSGTNSFTLTAATAQTLGFYDFNSGAQGWVVPGGSANAWKYSSTGGIGNSGSIQSNSYSVTDYAASPLLALAATKQYSLGMKLKGNGQPRHLVVSLGTAQNRTSLTPLDTFDITPLGSFTYKVFQFYPPADGSYSIVLTTLDNNYGQVYVDSVGLTRNILPVAAITAPANGSATNELSGPVTLTGTASDPDGTITLVEFLSDGVVLGSSTTSPYSYTWNYYLPGNHQLQLRATDNQGNKTLSPVSNFKINFSDGTLSPYVIYNFATGIAPWTQLSGDNVQWRSTGGYMNTPYLYYRGQTGPNRYVTSPLLFLTSGKTYTLQFRTEGGAGSSYQSLKAYVNTSASLTGATLVGTATFNYTENYATVFSYTFTAPSTNGFYIMLSPTSPNGVWAYNSINIDEVRLIGPIVPAPNVTMTNPLKGLALIGEGANLVVSASVADTGATVTSLAFKNGATTFANVTAPPFSTVVSNIAAGNYAFNAFVTNSKGAFNTSDTVKVTVDPNRLNEASYLGGTESDNDVRGAVILPDGTIALAANIGNASPGGLSPVLLGTATASSVGAILKLAADGKTPVSVTRLAGRVLDLSADSLGNLFVAAGPDGWFKLNGAATSILASATYASLNAFRIDAGKTGHSAVLLAPGTNYNTDAISSGEVRVNSPTGTELSRISSIGQYTCDVALDSKTQTVITAGSKNFATPGEVGGGYLPVFVPILKGFNFDGTLRYDAYDWSSDPASSRWLNKYDNNMADSKIEHVEIGDDGMLYAQNFIAGGNHIFRYDPFDQSKPVTVVGGDFYSTLANTNAETKTFIARHRVADGTYVLGQAFTGRLPDGKGNTVTPILGNIAADSIGRVYFTGAAAYGLPITLDYIPGGYTGGATLVVLSPDFATREVVTRFSTSGYAHCIAVKGKNFVVGGDLTINDLVTRNALQPALSGAGDGFFVTGNYGAFQSWDPNAVHPRLFFNATELAALRAKMSTAPYNRLAALMDTMLSKNEWGQLPYDSTVIADVGPHIAIAAFKYALTQNDSYAKDARHWCQKLFDGQIEGYAWANPSVKGLVSDFMAKQVAQAYDWCFSAPSWDAPFRYTVSHQLLSMAVMINTNGGSEQNTDPASNWQGIRGAAGILGYLATDHPRVAAQLDGSYNNMVSYINANLGGTGSRGWNIEGMNYTYYPWGNYVGPAGIAMARFDGARNIRNLAQVRNTFQTTLMASSNALNLLGFGGFHHDFTDDASQAAAEGANALGFYYVDTAITAPYKYWFDRLQGNASPYMGGYWDRGRAGVVWSYIYYPSALVATDPAQSTAWRAGYVDGSGNGMYTYRNAYQNGDDQIANFKAKLRNTAGAHEGPDGLGYRITGCGYPWVVGGGRNTPGNYNLQPALYPVSPAGTSFTVNRNTGTLVGTPASFASGSGHCIASMATDNLAVGSHKRWFVANYNKAITGADAVYIIADQSTNGLYQQLSLFDGLNVPTFSGNTFTVSAPNGAVMKGTVFYPGSNYRFATGTKPRGSAYGTYANDKYITLQADDGIYIMVLTISKTGANPTPSFTGSSAIVNSVITVGSATFTLLSNDVTYGGGAGARIGLADGPAQAAATLSLWPNPTRGGLVHLQMTGAGNYVLNVVTITNALGQVVNNSTLTGSETRTLDLGGHAPGVYCVTVAGNQGTQRTRFILE